MAKASRPDGRRRPDDAHQLLMQTLITTTIFYGSDFGLWNKVGPAAGLLLAFAIFFIIQLPLSVWWLRRFQYGPIEWLWRFATYGHRPAMLSRANAVAPVR